MKKFNDPVQSGFGGRPAAALEKRHLFEILSNRTAAEQVFRFLRQKSDESLMPFAGSNSAEPAPQQGHGSPVRPLNAADYGKQG